MNKHLSKKIAFEKKRIKETHWMYETR